MAILEEWFGKGKDHFFDKRKEWERTFDAIDDWICIINLDSIILRSNRSVEKFFNMRVQDTIGQKCCRIVHKTSQPLDGCPVPEMIRTGCRATIEVEIPDGRWMMITVDPFFDLKGNMSGAVHITRNITRRKLIDGERERVVRELQQAAARIKTLTGLIPICSICKKIRDDKGYWKLLESYIESHSEVSFSHGMCPDCTEALYGQEEWYIEMKEEQRKSGKKD